MAPFPFERRKSRADDVVIDIHFCGVIHNVRNDWGNASYLRCVELDQKLASHPAGRLLLVGHGYMMIAFFTLTVLNFPPVSSSLMKLGHTNHLTNPIRNLPAFTLEYPCGGSD